ncbi:FAS1 domain-containing protein [Hypoxylon cercidicola]|nr:FAS1 domain-containing protein [Hypoxylon cercidicola]
MRYSTTLLPLVAAATAVVIPDEATAKQLVLDAERHAEKTVSSWWHSLPSGDDVSDAIERQAAELHSLLREIEVDSEFGVSDFFAPSDATSGHGPHRHGPPHCTNLTIYESIHASNYTKKFAQLVDDFPDLVEKLNSTSAGNVTAFVPSDRAFEKIPDHGRKPPREFVEKVLQYHIVPGFYPAGRVLKAHTLPTALEEEALGGRPQRLRVRAGLFGVWLNGYSKVVFPNLFTGNGVVHGVDSILVPPPPVERLISLFPTKFSTLLLAAEKTGFKHHHHSDDDDDGGDDSHAEKLTGLTVFAPTNLAFKKLGPRANAFLFNTEKGLGYLKALLAYHVVANQTLYSDEFYGKKKEEEEDGNVLLSDEEVADPGTGSSATNHYHLDLPTLLGDKHIAVDVSRWFGFIRIRLNGAVDVAIQDAVAKDGVVQVVDSVLIPPHPHHKDSVWDDEVDGGISVEELIERLEPFVEGHDAVEAGEL